MNVLLSGSGVAVVGVIGLLVLDRVGPTAAAVTVLLGAGALVLSWLRFGRSTPALGAGARVPAPGLATARQLEEQLNTHLGNDAGGPPPAVLVVRLAGFRELDEALGAEVGDALLRTVGRRLAGAVRDDDIVAHLRGDEFAVALAPPVPAILPGRVAERIRAAVADPCSVDGLAVLVEARVGIASGRPTDTASSLLQQARVDARREATATQPLPTAAPALEHAQALQRSLEEDHLSVHYQPKVDLASGRVRGAEALVRWEHPTNGTIAPEAFLPLLDHTTIGRDVTLRVLELALHQAAAWHALGWPLDISVNVPASVWLAPQLTEDLARLLGQSGLPPEFLTLEVREADVGRDRRSATRAAATFKAMGVRLAIDGYGAGGAALPDLRDLEAAELKLPIGLVRPLSKDPQAKPLVRSAVHLGHALGAEVVAVGVEDKVCWELLRDMDCDAAQGFHIARALSPALFLVWLRTQPSVGRLRRP